MVIKRQCSFCAGEIEPGTGIQFVKRDGTIFHFCSGSCRKQQLDLGRVGHRVRWTRAHALKRELSAASSAGVGKSKPGAEKSAPKAPTPSVPSPPADEKPGVPKPSKSKAAKPKT